MTEYEKQEIVRDIFETLTQYSRTISQLEPISQAAADDIIELGNGKKISVSDLLKGASVNIEELKKLFLSKTGPEETKYLFKALGGLIAKGGIEADSILTNLLSSSNFSPGVLGTGMEIKVDPKSGKSRMVIDELFVRMKAVFTDLLISSMIHVGGQNILTPARMKCIKTEEQTGSYRCYFKTSDGEKTITNDFVIGDQATIREFNIKSGVHENVSNRYYWRLVTAIGDDYIDLSKTDCDKGSDIPAAGDDICQLGNRTDKNRQGAIILSSYGTDSPSFKQYVGINSYSLEDKEETRLMPGDNELSGVLHVKSGSTGAGNLSDLPDEVQKAVDLGSVNLLRNSGFTGQYENESLSPDTELSPDSELYNKKLTNWTGIASVQEDATSASGYSVTIGSLSQILKLIKGESYVLSYKAKGTSVAISCGDYSVAQPLSTGWTSYVHRFRFAGNPMLLLSGTAILCDLKLERGSIPTDWTPSPLDNDKSMAELQAISYLQDAIKNGSVDILGGLVLANMLQLGNYKDGVMQQVTAGVSGIYNDDDDVAYWAGGTMEQAIRTVMYYKDNPTATPTEEELKLMAKFAVTHGGRCILNDVIVRGYVYAMGGVFNGTVICESGIFKGSMSSPFKDDIPQDDPNELSIQGDSIVIRLDHPGHQVYWYPSESVLDKSNGKQFKIYVDAPYKYRNVFYISFHQPEPLCTHFKANGMHGTFNSLKISDTSLASLVMVPREDGLCDIFIENYDPNSMEISNSEDN